MSNAYELPGAGMSKGVAAIEASEDHLPGRLESEAGGGLENQARSRDATGSEVGERAEKVPPRPNTRPGQLGREKRPSGSLVHGTG